jgi:hypothetical protein
MVRIIELDCIVIVESRSCVFEGNTMLPDVGIFLSLVPLENNYLHMYIVHMIINLPKQITEEHNATAARSLAVTRGMTNSTRYAAVCAMRLARTREKLRTAFTKPNHLFVDALAAGNS